MAGCEPQLTQAMDTEYQGIDLSADGFELTVSMKPGDPDYSDLTSQHGRIDDNESAVAQLELSPNNTHSRKSPSLPPLRMTPLSTPMTMANTTTAAPGTTNSDQTENPVAATSSINTPTGSELYSGNDNSNGWGQGTGNSSNHNNISHQGEHAAWDDSTYPPPTPVSSPTDYFSSTWVLPPIPSFTEIGLTFDKSQTSSADATSKPRHVASKSSYSMDDINDTAKEQTSQTAECSNINDSGVQTTRSSHYGMDSRQQQPELIPDYNPSVFDHIQSDDNEAYILWSASLNANATPTLSPDSTPTTSHFSRAGGPSSFASSHQLMQNLPPLEPASAVKRWSTGDSFKGKDKGRDSLDSDTSAPEIPPFPARLNSEASLARQSISQRSSGTASIPKSSNSSVVLPSKVTSSDATGSAPITSTAPTNAQENRVIMAATVEKLIEKLTSDIDYTFLTDFFLIYRLFISPMALLRLLMARFQWALTEDTPQRQIARVRTFVAMRHWLLNYFEYDFMGSKALRQMLIQDLRSLAEHAIVCKCVRNQRIVKELQRLYRVKRKAYSREKTQRALERSASKPRETNRDDARHRRPASRELNGSIQRGKRSSMDASGADDKRRRRPAHKDYSDLEMGHRYVKSDDERYLGGESTDSDMDNASAAGQSEDEIYQKNTQYMMNRSQELSQQLSEDDTDILDFEEDDRSQTTTNLSSAHLPSPARSAVSYYSHRPQHERGAVYHPIAYSETNSRYQQSSDISEHSHHQYYCHTVPRVRGTNVKPRPLSYGAPSLGSSTSLTLSPPDSPRPVEPYLNPPPRSAMSPERKKTWSQYMSATVEQLTKVKRAILPKSPHSIQDIYLTAGGSISNQSLVMGAGSSFGEGRRRKSHMKLSTNTQCWQEDRELIIPDRVSQSINMRESLTTTDSMASSSAGHGSIRDERRSLSQDQQRSLGSCDWSSDEEDIWFDHLQSQQRAARAMSITSTSQSLNLEHQSWEREWAGGETDSFVHSTSGITSIQNSVAADDQELVAAKESMDHGRSAMNWEQHASKDPTRAPGPGSRLLRRTTPKRDNRQSWMSTSSANSLVFGAVLTQGHVPPSQTLKEGVDPGNVDRFVERIFKCDLPNIDHDARSLDPGILDRRAMRRRSVDTIRKSHSRQGSMQGTLDGILEKTIDGSRPTQGAQESTATNPSLGARRSYTLTQHPHRQTVPIMHHHYHHHHYLQQRQSLQDYPPQRRHSTDIQSLVGWSNMCPKDSKAATATREDDPLRKPLLEGAAYAAALEETRRQLELMASQRNQSAEATDSVKHSEKETVEGETQPGSIQTSSSSDPHLLDVADAETSPPAVKPTPRAGPITRGSFRYQLPMFYPSQSDFPSYHSHERSYNQQRSPMNNRFQNILSSSREYPRHPPSIVLRFRSEAIAQQLCLIERELLSQVQWHELINAGWKKKPAETSVEEEKHVQETTYSIDTQQDGSSDEDSAAEEPYRPSEESSARLKNPWPFSRSSTAQTARTYSQRFPCQGQTKDSPSVTQLVDRFNLTCHWVTSEILKTTNLDLRVRVVEKFIRIAHTCYNHSNFSSLTQMMLGLQAHEVSRLNRTWARVRPQEMRIMQDLVEYTSPFHNWKQLRGAMKNIADEWGGAAGSGATPASTTGSNEAAVFTLTLSTSDRQQQQQPGSASLFSKMSISSRDKDRGRLNMSTGSHPRQASHQHTQSFGKSSGQTVSVVSGHSKSLSGPVFPSLVNSLSKDKDREKQKEQRNPPINSMPPQPQNDKDKDKAAGKAVPQQGTPHGGSIPFLGVYLSDLVYNTELPSFVEPKAPAVIAMSAIFPNYVEVSSAQQQLPSPPQSATTLLDFSNGTLPSSIPWMVNLHKHRTIATIIKRILTFQSIASRYPFVKDSELYELLKKIEILDQEEMERMSGLCEEKATTSLSAFASHVRL
ncbi:hypothetical protein BG011_008099 [Mortierella polycephala]|uniref:Ras GEF n=1 Tax=Mortierella polycephala TaxID=41804 RepID=A0A9P6QDV3_9FUNG|nr:hypothetical protein BG011_008099 [Mortierella polycephala]